MIERYRMDLSYDGSAYFGWQVQPRQISVQETIERVLRKLYPETEVSVTGCGRTDTGVHARNYVLHTDLPATRSTEQLLFKMNRMLPESIAIHAIELTTSDFHARFGASRRTYRYYVHTRKDPFLAGKSLLLSFEPDFERMQEAAAELLGKHDFTSFSKLHTDVKTNICTVYSANWVRVSDSRFYFEITADRFLRNMVRAVTGTLLDVGKGKCEVADMKRILNEKDRGAAGKSIAAHGLYLWQIAY